ncbi:hypothetical protein FS842_000347 [Serendipita sp. 407]|nr:hypothetical protein FS842_000347 [Serendipita sp. 407]
MSTLVLNPLSTTPMLARTSSPYRMVIRRNALVPLPLLPPPPANTSVTSVRVIHNVMPGEDCPPSPVPPSPSESPTSPTQASFYVSAKQKACSIRDVAPVLLLVDPPMVSLRRYRSRTSQPGQTRALQVL